MVSRFRFSGILSVITIMLALSRVSFAQSSDNLSYIVKTSGDTIRNFRIHKAFKSTNENKVTYFHNDEKYSIPAGSIQSYYHNDAFYTSEFLKNENRHVLISYIVGGPVHFGQSAAPKGGDKFYLKLNDTQEVIGLSEHRNDLLKFLKGFLPDFDAFYSKYNAKILYEYKSLAELFTAYNAFREPGLYVPVRYKYREHSKFGISASYGKGSLELIDQQSDFKDKHNYSVGLVFRQFYTRNIGLNLSLSYNNALFNGTNEDLHIRDISFDPAICFGTMIRPGFDIALRGGYHLGYNINSNLSIKTGEGEVLDITGFNHGPQIGVDFIILKKYSVFINYLTCNVKTDEGPRFLLNDIVKAKSKNLQFGVVYYFKSVYSR
jgi:hypothetical protein